MSIEAMKQALEALEHLRLWVDGPEPLPSPVVDADNAITALRTAIAEAEKQEPVAWMIIGDGKFGEYGPGLYFDFHSNEKYWKNRGYKMVPVYTAPPAAQQDLVLAEREAVCRIVTGLCISDNNAEEINRAIRARGQA